MAHDKRQGTSAFRYRSKAADCKNCPLREACVNKAGYKSITVTVDRDYYERAEKRINTRKGKRMMRSRAKTVEPVWGTLINFRAIKKVYTKGIDLADKQVLLAAMAYTTIKSASKRDETRCCGVKLNCFVCFERFFAFLPTYFYRRNKKLPVRNITFRIKQIKYRVAQQTLKSTVNKRLSLRDKERKPSAIWCEGVCLNFNSCKKSLRPR